MQPPPYQEEYTKPTPYGQPPPSYQQGFTQNGTPMSQPPGPQYGYPAAQGIYSAQPSTVFVTTQPHYYGGALVMPMNSTPPSNVIPNPCCVISMHRVLKH